MDFATAGYQDSLAQYRQTVLVDGVLDAGAPGVAVEYRDARKPALSWSLRRGTGDLASGARIPRGASFRIGSVTKAADLLPQSQDVMTKVMAEPPKVSTDNVEAAQ